MMAAMKASPKCRKTYVEGFFFLIQIFMCTRAPVIKNLSRFIPSVFKVAINLNAKFYSKLKSVCTSGSNFLNEI